MLHQSRAIFLTGLLSGSVLIALACGDDPPDTTDDGGIITPGGNAGQAGESTAGEPSSSGGSGDTGGMSAGGMSTGGTPSSTDTDLGMRCTTDSECGDLDCVAADSGLLSAGDLGNGGPANGMCTQTCETNDDCQPLGAGAVCVGFSEDASYCLQGCQFGPDGLTEFSDDKCHGRFDMTCGPLFGDSQEACADDSDCFENEFCAGTCIVVVPACLPQCADTTDCPDGMFCDPGSGICVEEEPSNKKLGDDCDPDADPDECNGLCLAEINDDNETVGGRCHEFCTLGVGAPVCGWDGMDGPPAICLPALSEQLFGPGVPGDAGLCYQFCNCDSDCSGSSICWEFDGGPVAEQAGYCDFALNPDGTERQNIDCGDQPSSGGSAGAGGQQGTSGAAGAAESSAGAGGAP